VLTTEGPLPVPRALAIAAQVASALGAAHEHGILHRDLKPANIYLTAIGSRREAVKVIDFGISKITREQIANDVKTASEVIVGTPLYMPPEQARGEILDVRADVYALAVILYEMLTGQRPFDGRTPFEILSNAERQRPRTPSDLRAELPAVVDALVLDAMASDRDVRTASMRALFDRIIACLDDLGVEHDHLDAAAPPRDPAPAAARPRSSARSLIVVVASVSALVSLALVLLIERSSPRRASAAQPSASSVAPRAAAGTDPASPSERTAPPESATALTRPVQDAIELSLGSRPGGAAVYRDGSYVGTTPVVVQLQRGSPAPVLLFRLAGYADARLVAATDEDAQLTAVLERSRAQRSNGSKPRAKPRPGPPPRRAGDPVDPAFLEQR
jgi:serine/threonine-protein kinase